MKNFRTYFFLFLFVIFGALTFYLKIQKEKKQDYKKKAETFSNVLHNKETLLNTLFDKALEYIKDTSGEKSFDYDYFRNFYDDNEIALIISQNDSAIFWSTNSVPVEDIRVDTLPVSQIVQLSNGWYEIKEKRYNNFLIRGAILIKNEYRYQNDYLVNGFQEDFNISGDCSIELVEGEYNIFSIDSNLLCSLAFKKTKDFPEGLEFLMFLSFILAYISSISFFVLFLQNIFKSFSKKNKIIWALIITIFICCIRYLTFHFKFPAFIYNLDAFGPKYYANSSFLPSLGDLFLHVFTFFLIVVFLFRSLRNVNLKSLNNKFLGSFISYVLLCFVLLVFFEVFEIFKGLIINSNLIFDLNNIFGLEFYSISGFFLIAILLLSFFLIAYFLTEISYLIIKRNTLLFYSCLFTLAMLTSGITNYYYFQTGWIYFILIVALLAFIVYYLRKNKLRFSMQAISIYLVLLSFLSTYCYYEYSTYKEREKRKLLASQLSLDQDPIAEFLYVKLAENIEQDTLIKRILLEPNPDQTKVTDVITKNYFNGYWSRYNLQLTLCQPGQILNIKPDDINVNCDSFFNDMVQGIGQPTSAPDLFLLDNGTGRNSYVSKIAFYNNDSDSVPVTNCYLELNSKFVPSELGYPELLIDKDIKINRDLFNYSYAKYKNKELVLQFGKYYYGLSSENYKLTNNEYTFFEREGYDHLFYQPDAETGIIISKKSESLLYIIAPFSYIFVFYCFCVFVFLMLLYFPLKRQEINLNFKTRVQISMVSVLILSFVIIGLTTLYYIISIYNKKNLDNISEKAHSVLIETENKIGDLQKVTPDTKEYIAELLTKFQNVFFTDINFYTPDGMLVASSCPQVFDEGMISKRMDSKAFIELSKNKNTFYIHDEKIGNLNYLSAYVPFRNNDYVLTGYLNLPYFAKQSELKKEISTFFTAFINIIVMLTALAVIISLLVANYITRPLKFIMEKMGQIKLGGRNEIIEWKRKDEIGSLINEYNRMIDELSRSAELLARSERESAWREMAKQIAHEIKNPLTPMKLNVQQLQKSWDDKSSDWNERLNRFTQSMIEQIESLNKIASEFSDFAKMPKAINEMTDLVQLIENTVSLYIDYKITINFEKPENTPCQIFVDKSQIIRVLNNLIKNSVQAVEGKSGIINIKLIENKESYIIEIADNGTGISDEQKNKIFSPNFTTKTGGMGLGLAMVKSIIESYNGKIWFESEKGKGTTFFIELLK
jgi:two-component system, NtrC family, nitrogen regulation sensor histidine kinase NtrY